MWNFPGTETKSFQHHGTRQQFCGKWLGRLLQATPLQTFKLSAPIRDGAISPNGGLVLLGSDNNSAELYTTDGISKQKFVGHTSPVFSVNFSPNGKYVLTGSWDNTVRLWDLQSGNIIRLFANHINFVSSTAFSPDGKQIITGSYDKTARLWNADPLHDARTIYRHLDPINSVSYSPDGITILSASRDNSVGLWNAETLELEDSIKQSDALLDPKAVFSAGGRWIAAGSEDYKGPNPNIVFWEKIGTEYPKPVVIPTNHNHVSSLVFSPPANGGESEYLLTSYENGQLDLWQNVDGYWNTVRTVIEPELWPNISDRNVYARSKIYSQCEWKHLNYQYSRPKRSSFKLRHRAFFRHNI